MEVDTDRVNQVYDIIAIHSLSESCGHLQGAMPEIVMEQPHNKQEKLGGIALKNGLIPKFEKLYRSLHNGKIQMSTKFIKNYCNYLLHSIVIWPYGDEVATFDDLCDMWLVLFTETCKTTFRQCLDGNTKWCSKIKDNCKTEKQLMSMNLEQFKAANMLPNGVRNNNIYYVTAINLLLAQNHINMHDPKLKDKFIREHSNLIKRLGFDPKVAMHHYKTCANKLLFLRAELDYFSTNSKINVAGAKDLCNEFIESCESDQTLDMSVGCKSVINACSHGLEGYIDGISQYCSVLFADDHVNCNHELL